MADGTMKQSKKWWMKMMFLDTPWKINGWNLQITQFLKGKWSEPNLHDYGHSNKPVFFQSLQHSKKPLKDPRRHRQRFMHLHARFCILEKGNYPNAAGLTWSTCSASNIDGNVFQRFQWFKVFERYLDLDRPRSLTWSRENHDFFSLRFKMLTNSVDQILASTTQKK